MTFNDLKFDRDALGTIRAECHFDNGYGASVIKGPFTYGGKAGLYELAVLHEDDICYTTPVTDDVVGWCTKSKITGLLKQIENLPRK